MREKFIKGGFHYGRVSQLAASLGTNLFLLLGLLKVWFVMNRVCFNELVWEVSQSKSLCFPSVDWIIFFTCITKFVAICKLNAIRNTVLLYILYSNILLTQCYYISLYLFCLSLVPWEHHKVVFLLFLRTRKKDIVLEEVSSEHQG